MRIDSVKTHKVQGSKKFFLDSNVWLYLLYPQSSKIANRHIRAYSNFYNRVISVGALVLTNLIQISELINVILQTEYRIHKKKGNHIPFKEFRSSEDGGIALSNAKVFISQVVKTAELQTGLFNSDEMKNIVFDCDKADFNDIYFAAFCERQDAILVTHDFDFRALSDHDLLVLSANENYFS